MADLAARVGSDEKRLSRTIVRINTIESTSPLSAGENVDYRLIRARRRTIGMEVDLSGLTVRAPRWVTIRDIEFNPLSLNARVLGLTIRELE